jgi:hypothetical protein
VAHTASPFTLSVPGGNPNVLVPVVDGTRGLGQIYTDGSATVEREQFPGHKPLSYFGAHWLSDGWSARKQARNENRHPHNHLDTPPSGFSAATKLKVQCLLTAGA